MKQYHTLLQHILDNGTQRDDRTGTGTTGTFGYQMRFDLSEGFPLLTTKKLHLRSIIYELLWFIKGDTNIRYLDENKVRIWDEWPFEKYKKSKEYKGEDLKAFRMKIIEDEAFAKQWGELGPVYGAQWRRWLKTRQKKLPDDENQMTIWKETEKKQTLFDETDFPPYANYSTQLRKWKLDRRNYIDQLSKVIRQIKNNPNSRRHIVCAWNPGEIQRMALPPCHCLFQFYVAEGKLSCQLYQRSADTFLGVPFNIASYALLTMMMAQVCGLQAGEFIHSFGDVHLYLNHIDQAELQLTRELRPLPKMKINPEVKSIFDFRYEDFELLDYNPHPHIKAEVSV